MEYSVSIYFLYFIILSILGWIMEVILQIIQYHKFTNRGFLIGPYCPIYGCGGLLIALTLSNLKEHPVALFAMVVLISGVLEYLTSYIMEKIFNARWWDYSKNKFNINGRICLETIIPFGILGLMLIYFINPFIFDNLDRLPYKVLNIISIGIAVLFITDLIVSLNVILNVKKVTKKFDKENPKDNTEKISQKVKEFLINKSKLSKRLINAFPELTAILKERKEQIIKKTEKIKEELTQKADVVKDKVKRNLKKKE